MFFAVMGKLTKLGEKDVPVMVDTKNAEFTGHKAIWQNSEIRKTLIKPIQQLCWNQLQLG